MFLRGEESIRNPFSLREKILPACGGKSEPEIIERDATGRCRRSRRHRGS